MRQTYTVGLALAGQAGLEWPATRDEAGVLLRRLREGPARPGTLAAAGGHRGGCSGDAGEGLQWEATIAKEGR